MAYFFKAVDFLDARGLLQDPQFYMFLRSEFPAYSYEIELAAMESGAGSLKQPRENFLAQSLPGLIERRPWEHVREYLVNARGLLPIEFSMGTKYSYVNNVVIAGVPIDQIAVRVDTGGPRCFLYYLCDPNKSLFQSGVKTVELDLLLISIRLHVECLRPCLDRGHPLFGLTGNWDAELIGAMRDFGCRWFHVVIIGGRRSALSKMDKDARNELIASWRANERSQRDIMTYDRLWTAQSPRRNKF